MFKMKFTKITFFFWFLLNVQIFGQDQNELTNLRIEAKQNGLFLTVDSSKPLSIENITGWVNEDWFYMTVHQATGDSVDICSTPFSPPIMDIDNTNTDESTQIAIRINGQVENFELYLSENDQTIIAALYYPAETILAMVENEENELSTNITLSSKLKHVLFLLGGALTISGVISGDGSNDGQMELILGLAILVGTHIYYQVTS